MRLVFGIVGRTVNVITTRAISSCATCANLYTQVCHETYLRMFEGVDDGVMLSYVMVTFEPPHEKTNNLQMRKQRRRSASRCVQCLCFHYTDSTLSHLKSEISSF